ARLQRPQTRDDATNGDLFALAVAIGPAEAGPCVGWNLVALLRWLLDVEVGRRLRAVLAQVLSVAVNRVAAPVEAERFLLVIELLDLGPGRNFRQCVPRRAARVVVAAEQVVLTQIVVALFARTVLARRIDGCKQSSAARSQMISIHQQRIARTRLDKRLEHPLVRQAQIEDLAQRVQRRDASAQLRAREEDRIDRSLAESL